MANTFTKIATVTVGSGGASSIDFTSIPQTYTDLCLKISGRLTGAATEQHHYIKFNSSTTSYTSRYVYGSGSAAYSANTSTNDIGVINAANSTANTFNSTEIYIPNYAGSNYKSFSNDNVEETNATTAYIHLIAHLWSNTSAITSITITGDSNFAQYSIATLYGIKNA